MEITKVAITLTNQQNPREPLRAFVNVTLDACLVLKDLKIVQFDGGLNVKMPERKMDAPCPSCRTKNHKLANFCNKCGKGLPIPPQLSNSQLFVDVVHPITQDFRAMLDEKVMAAYYQQIKKPD